MEGREPLEEWANPSTGYLCRVYVGPLGNLNGYTQVPDAHPWSGVDFLECVYGDGDGCPAEHTPADVVDVHGGLTYSGELPGGGWWFGFDTAHAFDWVPGLELLRDEGPPRVRELIQRGQDAGYYGRQWTRADVVAETDRMAQQLAAVMAEREA